MTEFIDKRIRLNLFYWCYRNTT